MSQITPIAQLPAEERPRERLMQYGPEVMSSQELLAILLGSGTKAMPVLSLAKELLVRFGSLHQLAEATLEELLEIKGVGMAKAIQIKASFSLGKRAANRLPEARPKITSPKDVFALVRDQLEFEKIEKFIVLMLDVRGRVIAQEVVSIGTLTRTLVHPREVFFPAIRNKAAVIILVHNHPSGDPSPSEADYTLTKRLVEGGELIGIGIQDHIIVGHQEYVSLREKGFTFR